MSSAQILGKALFFNSSRIARLYINKHPYHVRNLCLAADFKLTDGSTENRRPSYKISPNSTDKYVESDEFGNLTTPLENSVRRNRNFTTSSKQLNNKKVIKIKKPKSKIDESDTFGNLSENSPMWYPDINEESKVDNDLDDDSVIIKNISKRYRKPEVYLHHMKEFVKQKKIKEALDLFVDMRRNFVAPNKSHFTYLIGVCGKVGYTEMAFKLLRQMTDRGLQPTSATLTGVFNSCAESPFPEYGLKKALRLKEKIKIKNWELTQITYHAMIKAFGKCGDLGTAFEIVDEMAKADIKIDVETYSFLLTSCISNKEAGFTYAVEVWRKMNNKKCKPNIFTFNLLLRAARDCGVGPEEISCLLLQHWSSYTKRPYGFITKESLNKEQPLQLGSGSNNCVNESIESENEKQAIEAHDEEIKDSVNEENIKYELKTKPNTGVTTTNQRIPGAGVLTARPVNGPEILEILSIKTPDERLSLIGGLEGFLELMFNSQVNPDIKTFTLLLQCLPDNIEVEEKLLSFIDKYEVKPDINFFNVLMKRRIFRKEDKESRDVLILINKYAVTPDLITYGTLALGCRTLEQASNYISEMEKMGAHPNIEIIGAMIKRACMIVDFPYMKFLLEFMEEHQIKPNEMVLKQLEKCLSIVRKNIILMEHGKEVDEFYQRKKNLQTDFKKFSNYYEKWLKRMKFQPEEHPWLQYETEIIDKAKEERI